MADTGESLIQLVRSRFADLHRRAAGAIEQLGDAEFNDRASYSREQVLAILKDAFDLADRVTAELSPARLGDPAMIRERQTTVLEVLFGTAAHMSEHVGQILYIAKLRLGPQYRVLSLPHKRR